jgi:hypothetical protein
MLMPGSTDFLGLFNSKIAGLLSLAAIVATVGAGGQGSERCLRNSAPPSRTRRATVSRVD